MPLYDYKCCNEHVVEKLRSFVQRDAHVSCDECQQPMNRQVARPHCVPDGMYSYAPNLGDPVKFEKRMEAQRLGKRVIEGG